MEPIRGPYCRRHPLNIEGLKSALARHSIKVVATASADDRCRPSIPGHHPRVVVLDVRFGDRPSGLDVAKDLLRKDPHTLAFIQVRPGRTHSGSLSNRLRSLRDHGRRAQIAE